MSVARVSCDGDGAVLSVIRYVETDKSIYEDYKCPSCGELSLFTFTKKDGEVALLSSSKKTIT